MDKRKINEIAGKVLAHLGTLPIGAELSMWQATKQAHGCNDLDDMDLFEINKQVRHEAKKAGIVLDDSKYDDCDVGLPFNIPFVIKKTK